jgi:hypothetical protein
MLNLLARRHRRYHSSTAVGGENVAQHHDVVARETCSNIQHLTHFLNKPGTRRWIDQSMTTIPAHGRNRQSAGTGRLCDRFDGFVPPIPKSEPRIATRWQL